MARRLTAASGLLLASVQRTLLRTFRAHEHFVVHVSRNEKSAYIRTGFAQRSDRADGTGVAIGRTKMAEVILDVLREPKVIRKLRL